MNTKGAIIYSVLCFILFWTGAASAGKADITGTSSYQTSGTSVNIKLGRITNNTTTQTTGSIYVTLRFTTGSSPFSSGYNVARKSLNAGGDSQLSPGEYFYNISFNTTYSRPPDGTYYAHIFVSEYPRLDTSLDYVTFSKTVTIGGGNGGNTGNTGIDMSGNLSYSIVGNSVKIKVAQIKNNSQTTRTGTLYVTMWLTKSPDLFSSGYLVARKSLSYINGGTLSPGHSYTGISFTTNYDKPPDGTYYVHFYVSQYPNLDTVLDSSTFGSQLRLGIVQSKPGKPRLKDVSRNRKRNIALRWSSAARAERYRVYRANCKRCQFGLVKDTGSKKWTDKAVKPGKRYWYRVKACNSEGCGKTSNKSKGSAIR